MRWDKGSSLGLVYGEDSFRKLNPEELSQEKNNGKAKNKKTEEKER